MSSLIISLLFGASVSSGLRKSLSSSSHIFLVYPTTLHAFMLTLRQKFHPAAFLAHRFSGSDAITIAHRNVILLCVSIQHGISAALIRSSASAVLLPLQFMLCRLLHQYRS